ncbi:hypothetical protein AAFC00_004782 [Neodothiora populina]|uniref:Uncharacterized protein n=1 Tax=Neodothiora populina TaxID=2781224 RepID=A0ABR3P3F3_9PEZI
MTVPTAQLSQLHRADGSATYSSGGYTVIAAVNGPIEVQRRDELPEEAAIEVNVRPASGVGSPKERHLESIVLSTLRHIILTHNHPRTLIQVTLQVISTPLDESLLPPSFAPPILPALLQASVLSLLSASIPLSATLNAVTIAALSSGSLILDPTPKQLTQAASTHTLAFSSHGELIMEESEGSFDMATWHSVYDEAEKACCKPDDSDMQEDRKQVDMQTFVERVIEANVEAERGWKND